jgi:hypothetical protein
MKALATSLAAAAVAATVVVGLPVHSLSVGVNTAAERACSVDPISEHPGKGPCCVVDPLSERRGCPKGGADQGA